MTQVEKDGKMVDRAYNCFDIADKLTSRGWLVPAYQLAPNAQATDVPDSLNGNEIHVLPLHPPSHCTCVFLGIRALWT